MTTLNSVLPSRQEGQDNDLLLKTVLTQFSRWIPDLLATALLVVLPLITFWALWAPNPADRLMLRGDILMQGYPSRFFVHRLFNAGEIPLWNPYQLAGMPLLGDVQVAVFYLPNLILDWLYLGQDLPYLAFEGVVIAHYALGGIFFYAYLRNLKVGPAAALVGAIAFEFNGFFIGHRGHYNMFGVVVWVPAVLWLLDRAWQANALRGTILWTALAGLALSQMLMAGHPQLAMYSMLFILAYFIFRWSAAWPTWGDWWQSPWSSRLQHPLVRRPLSFGVAGMLAGGIAAVALLPTAELLGRSMRSEPTYAFSTAYSLLPRNFITLLVPEFLEWSTTEFRLYAGILTLILALVAWTVSRRNRPEQRFYTIVLLVAIVVALGGFTALQGIIYRYLPGFAMVRVSARAFFFANFALAVLAAFGAETLFRFLDPAENLRLEKLARYSRWTLAIAGLVAVVFYFLLVWYYELPDESFYVTGLFDQVSTEETFLFLTRTANQYLLFVLFLLAATGLLWIRGRVAQPGRGFVAATILVMILDVTTFAPYHDTVQANPEEAQFTIKNFGLEIIEEPWQQQDQQQLLTYLNNLPDTIRIDNRAEVLPDNYSQVWGMPFNSGYNILDLQDRFDLHTQWPYVNSTQAWDLFNVGYILTEPDVLEPPEPGAQLELDNSQGKVWQRTRQPAYATFSTQIRPVDDLQTVRGLMNAFPDSYQSQTAVSPDGEELQHILAETWPEKLAPARYNIGQTGQMSPVDISVLSGGLEAYSAVIVGGVTVTPEQRGIVLAGIDPQSGEVIATGAFDTYLMASESDRMAAAINAIPDGTIVALATYDEGTASLTDRGRAAIADLGATEDLRDKFGQAYGLIGVKGSTPGTAVEQLSPEPLVLDVGVGAASASESSFNYELLTYQPNRITLLVENNQPGILTISEAVYPGWSAEVNGEPVLIQKANGLFRSIILPGAEPGQPHEVTFVYQPFSFRLGAAVSILTLAFILGTLLAIIRWDRIKVWS